MSHSNNQTIGQYMSVKSGGTVTITTEMISVLNIGAAESGAQRPEQ